ncbi:hypothetical protein AB0E67_27605 [Streptomyces sp. NPDC032161]|uniref:hypothetical protein n=1 Tax=unclassified Streptomyces TaxID=2593676 RepID=UPI0033DA22C2
MEQKTNGDRMGSDPAAQHGEAVAPRCSFYVRTEVTTQPPTFKYDLVPVRRAPGGTLSLPTPPSVGDLVWLDDELDQHTGTHRIVERSWGYSVRGSQDWPWDAPHPRFGPLLTLIVVPDTGPFRNEAKTDEEDSQ